MNDTIPIFDSLTHPTLNGNWLKSQYDGKAFIDKLLQEMQAYNVYKAFAVGMEGIGDYHQDSYIKMVQDYGCGKLLPIAFLSFNENSLNDIKNQILEIKKKGYYGIKLHPRIGNFLLNDDRLRFAIDFANEQGLTVLFCTYFYSTKQSYLLNNIDNLGELLLHIDSKSKIVLLHGGAVEVLKVMEIVRAFQNTLLDLSFTINKYAGSSLDNDIQYLFQNFDRRICIGSDFPEFSLETTRNRFDCFSQNISKEKAENIAFRNLESFISIR